MLQPNCSLSHTLSLLIHSLVLSLLLFMQSYKVQHRPQIKHIYIHKMYVFNSCVGPTLFGGVQPTDDTVWRHVVRVCVRVCMCVSWRLCAVAKTKTRQSKYSTYVQLYTYPYVYRVRGTKSMFYHKFALKQSTKKKGAKRRRKTLASSALTYTNTYTQTMLDACTHTHTQMSGTTWIVVRIDWKQ